MGLYLQASSIVTEFWKITLMGAFNTLQVLAIEFVPVVFEFVTLANEYVPLAIEFVALAQEFVIIKLSSRKQPLITK